MSVARVVQYTLYCDQDRCYYMPRTRTTYRVGTLKEAYKAATHDGWTIKRSGLATCPHCNTKTRGIG